MKRTLSLILALLMIVLCVPSLAVAEQSVEMLDNGMTYATGYPITKEVIELDVLVRKHESIAHQTDTKVIDYILEKTNIKLNIRTYTENEEVAMMFVDRKYPDFGMNLSAANSVQINAAAEAGDLVELSGYLEQLCPTWMNFYAQYPSVKELQRTSNGGIYTLPFCNFAPYDRNLRDQWFINKAWLDSVNLEVPKTLDEFTNALRAFRDNAGNGVIPENCYPYHFVFENFVNSSCMDLFASFGLKVSNNGNYLSVEDGKVVYLAADESIKAPLKYLQTLYAAQLISPEIFTAKNTNVRSMATADESLVGSCSHYLTPEKADGTTDYIAMAPIDCGTGVGPFTRRQTMAPNPYNAFFLFSNNQYPAATMRLIEFVVETPEQLMNVIYGMEGVYWEWGEDGKIHTLKGELEGGDGEDSMGFWNTFVGLRTEDTLFKDYFDSNALNPAKREWAYENLYKPYLFDYEHVFIGGTLNDDDTIIYNQVKTDVSEIRKTYFARWIRGEGDIDAEWDQYIDECLDAGMEEFVELSQKQYDLVH